VTRSTEDLIAKLAAEAGPVRRLTPPARRAALWLALMIGVSAIVVWRYANLEVFARYNGAGTSAVAWAASLATGIAAVVAAAYLSLPDRSRAWALLPLPFLALWLGSSSLGCMGLPAAADVDSPGCFKFILIRSGPVAAFLFWRLRRARPIDGRLVAVVGALGAAGLSTALLQFFHPFPITWLDLAFHLGAIVLIIGAGAMGGKLALSSQS
jgi:hypothetical protein